MINRSCVIFHYVTTSFFLSKINKSCVTSLTCQRSLTFSLYGEAYVVMPVKPSKSKTSPSDTLENWNFCIKFVNTRNISVFASDSPGHILGPESKRKYYCFWIHWQSICVFFKLTNKLIVWLSVFYKNRSRRLKYKTKQRLLKHQSLI